jgi:hypothetical protein
MQQTQATPERLLELQESVMTRKIFDVVPSNAGDAPMTKAFALAAAVLFGSGSLALAQVAVPRYDGNANPIRGAYQSVVQPAPGSFENAFAASRPVVRPPAPELDGDANPVPGVR